MSAGNDCVLIFHDGKGFVAQILDDPACIGRGATRVEALRRVEIVRARHASLIEQKPGKAQTTAPTKSRRAPERRHVAPIKALLFEKFGNLSNREIAARIGVVERDAPVMLSMALGGQGSRRVRCAIAMALGDLPSRIWPDRPARSLLEDDAEYSSMSSMSPNELAEACCQPPRLSVAAR